MQVIIKPGGLIIVAAALVALPLLAFSKKTPDTTHLQALSSTNANSVLASEFLPARFITSTADGTLQDITVSECPGGNARALRAESLVKAQNPWDIQAGVATRVPIAAGQKLQCSIWARSRTNSPIVVSLEQAESPYDALQRQSLSLSSDWKQYEFTVTASKPWKANDLYCRLWLAEKTGKVEVSGLELNTL